MASPPPEQETPPKSRRPRLIVLALVALGLSGAAAGAVYYFRSAHGGEPVAKPVVVEEPIFLALEPVTVNLQPNGRSRFLHVAVTLKIADAKSQAQVTQYLPEVRSRMLTVLSNRSGEALLTSEEKSRLTADLMAALNQPFAPSLPAQRITSVMFTTFMLQ